MTVKNLYAQCYGDNDLSDNTVVDSIAYAYDATWRDKLTSYDGNAITYDTIGNPLTHNGWNYTWEAGKQLKEMSDGTTTVQYKYNDAGLRTQKINGSTITKYYWDSNNISHMIVGTDELHFWYDALDQVSMLTFNGYNYYYNYDLNGNIIGLIDMTGNLVVTYTYDSWGKQISCSGPLSTTLGSKNPFRYRSYIYDNETGLYYINSRYYNPDNGRFINCDQVSSLSASPTELYDKNLYCYCDNNPIMRSDSSGKFWHIIIGALIGGIAEAASQLIESKGDFSKLRWEKIGVSTLAGAATAALGPFAGAAVSATANVALSVMDGKREPLDLIKSAAIGAGASLIGAGAGKIVSKIGSKLATHSLSKLSGSALKKTVNSMYNVTGAMRNATKDIGFVTKNFTDIGSRMFGKSVPQAFNSLYSAAAGWKLHDLLYR